MRPGADDAETDHDHHGDDDHPCHNGNDHTQKRHIRFIHGQRFFVGHRAHCRCQVIDGHLIGKGLELF